MDFQALKDKLLSSLGQATEGARGFAGKAADKAKTGSRIAKLSMELAREKENLKKTYLEIGKLYYDTHKDDPDGIFIQLCEEVAVAQGVIAEKEAAISLLKDTFSSDTPDIEVEFEAVVSESEAAAEAPDDDEDDD